MKKLYLLQVINFRLEFLRLPGWLKYDKEDIEKDKRKLRINLDQQILVWI